MGAVYAFGECELRVDQRLLLRGGEPLPLGGRAMDLLVLLVAQRHRTVGKQELIDHCWPDQAVEPNNLAVQVWALRRLLGLQAITTVPGRGYRFTADCTEQQAAPTLLSVLIVDDHPLFRDGVAIALQAAMPGLSAHTCDGVQQAQALLLAEPERFDLVLVDHLLPGGECGLDWARRQRLAQPALAIALISGDDDPSLPERTRQAGLSAFLPKSLHLAELAQALHSLARGERWFHPRAQAGAGIGAGGQA